MCIFSIIILCASGYHNNLFVNEGRLKKFNSRFYDFVCHDLSIPNAAPENDNLVESDVEVNVYREGIQIEKIESREFELIRLREEATKNKIMLSLIDYREIETDKSLVLDERSYLKFVWNEICERNLLLSPYFSFSLKYPYYVRLQMLLLSITALCFFNSLFFFDFYLEDRLSRGVTEVMF